MSRLKGGAQRRVQKLRCGWLPVNRRVARYDPDRHNGCPACTPTGELEETVDHVFQCPERGRRAAVLKGLKGLHDKFREWKTAYCIIKALTAGATAWIEGTDIPSVESLLLPDTEVGRLTAKAYVEQTQLGWNVLFRGFWTVSWRAAQEAVYRARTIREPSDNGEAWIGRAISWFFELFESIWTLRNKVQHGDTPEEERQIRSAAADRAIQRLFDMGRDLSHCERHPFRLSMEDILAKNLAEKELWVKLTEAYLPKAFRRQKERDQKGQRTVDEFFHRI